MQSIGFYFDTILGGGTALESIKTSRTTAAARDREVRESVLATSLLIRAPSAFVAPYAAVFALRRILTQWTNRVGAFAAALAIGPCGSLVSSADSSLAAATDSW